MLTTTGRLPHPARTTVGSRADAPVKVDVCVPCWLALSSASVTPSRPCHVSSPRHIERSVRISSHCALLFVSPQGLWDLSGRGDFQPWSPNPVAVEQPYGFVQPLPTPPLPAEALSFLSPPHMAPDLLFYPVFDEVEALAGMPDRKVVHPTAQQRVDQLHNPAHWLRSVAAEHVFELPQQCRSFLELWRVVGTPEAPKTAHTAEIET